MDDFCALEFNEGGNELPSNTTKNTVRDWVLGRVVLRRMEGSGKYALQRTFIHVFQHDIDRTIPNVETLTANNTKQKEGLNTTTIQNCGKPSNNYILERFGHDSISRRPKYSAK